MARLLPVSFIILAATAAAQAQQIDSVTSRQAVIAALPATRIDSLLQPLAGAGPIRDVCISVSAEKGCPAFTTIQPALSRVAGVQVTPFSGAPGAWATVRIRGIANVTGNSQPLYVVDGVPAYNTEATPEAWSQVKDFFDGLPYAGPTIITPQTPAANPLLDLPVEDIAQVEVLRGAAATARYGMQGTNGVILISTRRGADGSTAPQPLRVRYAGWAGVQQVRQRYDLLDARQYAGLANEAAAAQGAPATYSPADLNNLSETNWQDQVFRVAGIQSHNVSLDGRRHHTRYYVAADYLQQNGVIKESGLSRYHLRANLDQQLTAKLSVGLKASVSQTEQHYAGTSLDAAYLLPQALLAPPTPNSRITRPGPSPLAELAYYARAPRTRRLLAQLSATYQFSPELSLSVRGSRELATTRQLQYGADNFLSTTPNKVENGTDSTTLHTWVLDAALGYQHTFGAWHALTATLTYLRQQYDQALAQHTYGSFGQSRYERYFRYSTKSSPIHSPAAVVGYTYAGRYEVQASLRSDFVLGTDASRSEYRWLPGGQLSWHLNKEAFLAGAAGLSDLTVWAGTGQTSSFFSADRTTHHDAGLHLGILGGRLTLEAGAYQRRTRHAQAALPVLAASPGGTQTVYIMPDLTLLNRGLELTISSNWQTGPLAGTTQLAAATNHNQVDDIINNFRAAALFSGLENGQPVGRIFVFQQDGTYPAGTPQAGQVRYRDRNGDGRVDYSDGYYQGSGLPRYTVSLHQQLRLKRFQLEAQFDGLFGYQLLNATLLSLDAPSGYSNSSPRALDYWTPSHQDTNVPRAGSRSSSYQNSNEALASGSHMRLSQLTFSYDVLDQGPHRASVWVGGQNLFVTGPYRGFDPNVSSGGAAPLHAGLDASVYPVARVWQVGVRASF